MGSGSENKQATSTTTDPKPVRYLIVYTLIAR